MPFVHLHNHSEYSLLDGLSKPYEMAQRAKELGQKSIAITDHGNMCGAIDFYKACKNVGVKPIIGCEVYVAPESRMQKDEKRHGTNLWHLILLAKNYKGYQNLCNIVSKAYTEGLYYKPRVDFELLSAYGDDIIVSSACIQGQLPRYILAGEMEKAEELARKYKDRFGSDYYIEIMNHNIKKELEVNPKLISLAKKLDIKVIATHDSHYVKKDDAYAHDILLCIQQLKDYDDPNRMKFSGDSFYLKSEDEMRALFPEVPEAIENTNEVADKCNLDFDFKTRHLPKFINKEKGIVTEEQRFKYLRDLCEKNLSYRYDEITDEVRDRLEFELKTIKSMDFVDYFLVVYDFIREAKELNIAVGPGRGSAAGSIVSYLLQITDLDPLHYKLYFERFLNPERHSMPDIDIDFEDSRREEIIEYVKKVYGENCVSQIGTFGKLESRAAFRDVARAFKITPSEINIQSKKIPAGLALQTAYKQSEAFKQLIDENETYKKIYTVAKRLEHAVRNFSTHACGVLITDKSLWNYVPLAIDKNKKMVSMYEKNTVEELGLLKMDFLGLKNLTTIKECCELIKVNRNETIDLDKITLDDKLTYDLYKRGETIGVFQVESQGMQKWIKELKPDGIEDIIAMVALYRPGPMQNIPVFIQNKQNRSRIEYLDPCMEPVLKNTYGIFVYQEQVMNIAQVMSGFSMADADHLRKAMGKKIASLMEKQHTKFVEGAIKNGHTRDIAESVFSLLERFAEYGFNRAHAACYGLLSYRTAYLKANYSQEYMCSLLNTTKSDEKRLNIYIDECKSMNIEVLPPDINKGAVSFQLEKQKVESGDDSEVYKTCLRFGLAAIKNVGEAALEALILERKKNGEYRGVKDFKLRNKNNKVTKRTVEFLIKAGAFDGSSDDRMSLLDSLNNIRKEGPSLFGSIETEQEATAQETSNKMEMNLMFEKEALGFYMSGHPMAQFVEAYPNIEFTNVSRLEHIAVDQKLTLFCMIDSVRLPRKKAKSPIRLITVSDLSGTDEVVAYSEVSKQIEGILQGEDANVLKAFLLNISVTRSGEYKRIQIKSMEKYYTFGDLNKQLKKPSVLTVSIDLSEKKVDTVRKITELFENNPGKSEVVFQMFFKGYLIYTNPSQYRVARSIDFTNELEQLLSPKNFWWQSC